LAARQGHQGRACSSIRTSDLATHRANAGAILGQTSDAQFPAPNDAASRRFVIAVL